MWVICGTWLLSLCLISALKVGQAVDWYEQDLTLGPYIMMLMPSGNVGMQTENWETAVVLNRTVTGKGL